MPPMQQLEVESPAPGDEKPLPLLASMADIEDRYGVGMFLYFDFCAFIIVANVLLCVCTGINWGYHLAETHDLADGFELFFASGYHTSRYTAWLVTTLAAFVITFCMGWIYIIRAKKINDKRGMTCGGYKVQEMWEQDTMNLLPDQMGLIQANLRLAPCSRRARLLVSYFLFLVVTCISIAILGVVVARQVLSVDLRKYTGDPTLEVYYYPITVWDFVVSAVLVLLEFLGKRFCGWLTHIERHKTRMTHSKHKTIKLFIYKIVLCTTLYVAQRWVEDRDSSRHHQCPMRSAGIKFLSVLVCDATLGTFLVWAVPAWRLCRNKCKSDQSKVQPIQMDLANEYMDHLYRQYWMLLGLTVFPPITILVLIMNVFQYPLDRARLLLLCGRTKRTVGSAKYYLATLMSLVTLLGFFVWPNGGFWVLFGNHLEASHYCACSIYGSTCSGSQSSGA
eukprot:m51a1_g14655 hypothetical protein (449) ;mRNA; r:150950-153018